MIYMFVEIMFKVSEVIILMNYSRIWVFVERWSLLWGVLKVIKDVYLWLYFLKMLIVIFYCLRKFVFVE